MNKVQEFVQIDLKKTKKRTNCLLSYNISRCWINRLNYFAKPGPISNQDFLCKHGGRLSFFFQENLFQ